MITTQELTGGTQSVADSLASELRIWDGSDAPAGSTSAIATPAGKVVWTLRVLCAAALVVSGYLAYVGLTGSKIAGCGGGVWNCDHVTSTRWSKWFGLPVGLGACGLYVVCLGSLGFANSRNDTMRNTVWSFLTVGGISAGLAAVWFISLQVLVIGHLCKWCLVAHGCGLAVAGLILWHRPAGRVTTRLALVSVVGISVLVGGQLIYKPQTFEVQEFPDPVPGGSGVLVAPPGVDDDGAGGAEVFAPPGADMDDSEEFAPPVIEEFAPPPIED